jgi:hypothetical protein
MAERRLRLQYATICLVCGTPLAPGTNAWWDGDVRRPTCTTCHREPAEVSASATTAPAPASSTEAPADRTIPTTPHRYARLHTGREQVADTRTPPSPTVQRVEIGSDPVPTSTPSPAAPGEPLVGARLAGLELEGEGVVALHHRTIPGSGAHIDHIAVAPSGIYVIVARSSTGRLERRDKGGWFRHDLRLYVGGRDRTALTDELGPRTAAVRRALRGQFTDAPTHPMLCFVHPDIGLRTKPFEIRGVTVTWPREMKRTVRTPGPLDEATTAAIADALAAGLPPA